MFVSNFCNLYFQRLQASDENWDAAGEKKVWLCESSR